MTLLGVRLGRRTVVVECPAATGPDHDCGGPVLLTVIVRPCDVLDLEEFDAPCGHALAHESERDALYTRARTALKDAG